MARARRSRSQVKYSNLAFRRRAQAATTSRSSALFYGEFEGAQHQDGIHAYVVNQSVSDDTTSPPALVAIARHVGKATPSRTKTTWPSQNSVLTPPGWRLRAAFQPGLW